jgi:hypothetical protein
MAETRRFIARRAPRSTRFYLGVGVALSIVVGMLAAGPTVQADRGCGSIAVTGAQVTVRVERGKLSCREARTVLAAFWRGQGRFHARRPFGRSYTTVRGWTCPVIRAGFSQCTRGGNVIRGTYPLGKTG